MRLQHQTELGWTNQAGASELRLKSIEYWIRQSVYVVLLL